MLILHLLYYNYFSGKKDFSLIYCGYLLPDEHLKQTFLYADLLRTCVIVCIHQFYSESYALGKMKF